MNSIGSTLAQEIVSRTMQIIPFNVNVMDARGVILGSGEHGRIGELHAGAQLALAQQRAVEIDEATARSLRGVRPGVNLPLQVRGRPCGVVGLTGEPEAVRQFGELVRVTAEMILEQAQLIRELQRDTRYREEFVFQLVNADSASRQDLEAWASRLGVNFEQPCSVVVLELLDDKLSPDLALSTLQRHQSRLAKRRPELLSAVLSPRELVLLEVFEATGSRAPGSITARQRLKGLEAILGRESEAAYVMALGVALEGLDGVALSYQSACSTLRVGRQRLPKEACFSYYELSLPVLLAGLGSGWRAEQLRLPLQRLTASDKRLGVLRRTLDAWFEHDGHPAATAKALHIHRNTLDYRLRRISEITGLDLSRTDDRLLLYISRQLE